MSRDRRTSSRAFTPTLGASLEARKLLTAGPATRPDSSILLSPIPATVVPRIVSTDLVVSGKAVTGVSVTFNRPMKPSAVSNVRNYFLYDASSSVGKLKNGSVPLRSASYDPKTATVTLVPARRLDPSGTYLVTNVDISNPLKTEADIRRASARQSGFKSREGVPLNGLGTGTGSFGELVTRKPAPARVELPTT